MISYTSSELPSFLTIYYREISYKVALDESFEV